MQSINQTYLRIYYIIIITIIVNSSNIVPIRASDIIILQVMCSILHVRQYIKSVCMCLCVYRGEWQTYILNS